MNTLKINIILLIFASLFFCQCKDNPKTIEKHPTKEFIKSNDGGLIELRSDGTWKISDSIPATYNNEIMPSIFIRNGRKVRLDIFDQFLQKTKEPIIKKDTINWNYGAFRIIRTESFNPIQTITRIMRSGDSISIIQKEVEGTKSDIDFKIAIKSYKAKTLSINQWDKILKLARNSLFWDIQNFTHLSGTDGTRYIIEGAGDFNYNIINTREPSDGCLNEMITEIEKMGK